MTGICEGGVLASGRSTLSFQGPWDVAPVSLVVTKSGKSVCEKGVGDPDERRPLMGDAGSCGQPLPHDIWATEVVSSLHAAPAVVGMCMECEPVKPQNWRGELSSHCQLRASRATSQSEDWWKILCFHHTLPLHLIGIYYTGLEESHNLAYYSFNPIQHAMKYSILSSIICTVYQLPNKMDQPPNRPCNHYVPTMLSNPSCPRKCRPIYCACWCRPVPNTVVRGIVLYSRKRA